MQLEIMKKSKSQKKKKNLFDKHCSFFVICFLGPKDVHEISLKSSLWQDTLFLTWDLNWELLSYLLLYTASCSLWHHMGWHYIPSCQTKNQLLANQTCWFCYIIENLQINFGNLKVAENSSKMASHVEKLLELC